MPKRLQSEKGNYNKRKDNGKISKSNKRKKIKSWNLND